MDSDCYKIGNACNVREARKANKTRKPRKRCKAHEFLQDPQSLQGLGLNVGAMGRPGPFLTKGFRT